MRITLVLIITFLSLVSAQAKELKYPTFLISDTLKTNAYAVVRHEDIKVEIKSISNTRTTITKAITVLNYKGKKKAWDGYWYNKNKRIVEISARMYNSLGTQINKWGRSEWEDVSYDSYGTSYSGIRMLYLQPVEKKYPYTIEYKVVYEENNTYGINDWRPIPGDNLSIEKSTFSVKNTSGIKLHHKDYNFNDSISKTESENSINWELKNALAYEYEPYRPSFENFRPFVRVRLEKFKYDNYEGSTASWKEFGDFIALINKGRDELPDDRLADIDAILEKCNTDTEKVEALYKYMQSHTRYVNISVGIGGIQPHSATSVSENGYGDCKALSNYMYSMLKYAGIKSNYAVIKAGPYKYDFDPEFICHQSNHIILCVPMEQDTTWLECTSQTMPCGFLGDFTDNRHVLLITENGGVLTKTPKYNKKLNKVIRTAEVQITETGTCSAKLQSEYTGLQYDDKHRLAVEDKEEQLKLLYKDFNIPNFKIDNFSLNSVNCSKPKLSEEINLSLPNYASKSGSRLFLPVNLASKWNKIPSKVKDRTFDIYKKSESCYQDSITYIIPENFNIEVLPNKVNMESKYGTYIAETEVVDNKLIYNRYLELNSGVYPASEYDDFIDFYKQVQKNDNALAILKKIN
ncbi:DUF3857 domain-containing protein [Labilibacter marinus]|uniref:DUF3857 domain-containing protein n=1 Tax=Labilibacter marinus TaxID=1477105 RepID=UPI0008352807|nr:DUF3857 domain-containing protein [Labilibacter marinus]